MNIDKDQQAEMIINALGKLIYRDASRCASEQRYPGGASADDSDQEIKDRKDRIKALRELRERFENVITKVLLP